MGILQGKNKRGNIRTREQRNGDAPLIYFKSQLCCPKVTKFEGKNPHPNQLGIPTATPPPMPSEFQTATAKLEHLTTINRVRVEFVKRKKKEKKERKKERKKESQN